MGVDACLEAEGCEVCLGFGISKYCENAADVSMDLKSNLAIRLSTF